MTKSRRSVDSADAAVGEMSGEILRLNQRVSDMGKYVRSVKNEFAERLNSLE